MYKATLLLFSIKQYHKFLGADTILILDFWKINPNTRVQELQKLSNAQYSKLVAIKINPRVI